MDKSFLSRFIKGVASLSFGTFFQIGLGFFGLLIAVRYVPEEQFGVFVLLQVSASFFVMFSGLALENISVTKLITNSEEDQKIEIVNTAICYKLLICIVMSLVILFCKPLLNNIFKSEQLSQLLIYIPLYYLLNSFYDFFLQVLQGFHKYREMAISQIINGSIKFILIVVFLIILKIGIIGLIYAFLISFAVSIVFQYFVVPVKKQLKLDPDLLRRIFKFGFPLGLNSVLTFIFMKIDRFMIGAMISPLGVAYYEIAARIPDTCHRMYHSFQLVFFPNMSELFAEKRYHEAEKVLNNSLRLISLVTVFATLLATLFQKDIVRLLFSDRYLESAPALPLLLFSLSVGIVGNILGTSLVALGQSDKPVKINLVDTITNVAGNLILIPYFGFMGAVYATIISRCATNPFNVWFLRKGGVKVQVSHYLKPMLVFGLCGFLFLIIKPENIIIKISIIGLFLVLCLVFSIIRRGDISTLFESAKLTKM
jgi:O-antigen/teichoic acid export membrane protein